MKKNHSIKIGPRFHLNDEKNNARPALMQSNSIFKLKVKPESLFFVVKSFSEANFHKSLKYDGVWSTTFLANQLLQEAFSNCQENDNEIYFLYSGCGSRHFSALGRMKTNVSMNERFCLWEKQKYDGIFKIDWILVKDVPNYLFQSIKLPNHDNKSITASRDMQEVPFDEAMKFLKIFYNHEAISTIYDDFAYYDESQKKLEEKRGFLSRDKEWELYELICPTNKDIYTEMN